MKQRTQAKPTSKAPVGYKGELLLLGSLAFIVIAWISNIGYDQNPYICGSSTEAFNNAFVYIVIALLAAILGTGFSRKGMSRYLMGPILILTSLLSGVSFFMSMVMLCYRF